MDLQPINKKSISDQVFDQMKNQIANRTWKPGQKLPSETELTKIFNVSRVTIRNALQRLNTLGLIETRFGEGSFVIEANIGEQVKNVLIPNVYLQPHNAREVLQFRCAIEVETAGFAAEFATEKDIKNLKKIYKKQLACKNDHVAFADCDLRFHYAIASASGNSLITASYEILYEILQDAMIKCVESLGSEIGIPYHEKLISAIEAHDSHTAIVTMKAHMVATYESFNKVMDVYSPIVSE